MITTKDTASFQYKEFWVNLYRKADLFYWEISTNEFRTAKVWRINAVKYSLDGALELAYKDIQEDLENWDNLVHEMQGYYLEKFPGIVMPILMNKYIQIFMPHNINYKP